MDDKYSYDDIEKYLEGSMGEKERVAFEKNVETNAGLQEKVNFYRQLQSTVVKVEEEEDFAAMIRSVDKKLEQQSFFEQHKERAQRPFRIRKLWKGLAIAASVLLILWVGASLWSSQNYSDEALVAANFSPFEIISKSNRGEGKGPEVDLLTEGIDSYNDGNYTFAISKFQEIPAGSSMFTESRYYMGHAYLLLDQPEAAIESFNLVIASGELSFREGAEWYLVAALLLADHPEAEITGALDFIIDNEGHSFNREAVRLKNQLNSIWRML